LMEELHCKVTRVGYQRLTSTPIAEGSIKEVTVSAIGAHIAANASISQLSQCHGTAPHAANTPLSRLSIINRWSQQHDNRPTLPMMGYSSSAQSVALLTRRAIIITSQYLPTFGLASILISTISTLYVRTAYTNDTMVTEAINTSYYMAEVTQIPHTSCIKEASLR
jgi:hypothetical protein